MVCHIRELEISVGNINNCWIMIWDIPPSSSPVRAMGLRLSLRAIKIVVSSSLTSYTWINCKLLIDSEQRYPTAWIQFFIQFWNIFLIFAYVFLRLKMKWTDFGSQLLLMNQINYSNEVSTMWFTRCRESIHSKPENQVKNEFLTNFELTPNYTSPKP